MNGNLKTMRTYLKKKYNEDRINIFNKGSLKINLLKHFLNQQRINQCEDVLCHMSFSTRLRDALVCMSTSIHLLLHQTLISKRAFSGTCSDLPIAW